MERVKRRVPLLKCYPSGKILILSSSIVLNQCGPDPKHQMHKRTYSRSKRNRNLYL